MRMLKAQRWVVLVLTIGIGSFGCKKKDDKKAESRDDRFASAMKLGLTETGGLSGEDADAVVNARSEGAGLRLAEADTLAEYFTDAIEPMMAALGELELDSDELEEAVSGFVNGLAQFADKENSANSLSEDENMGDALATALSETTASLDEAGLSPDYVSTLLQTFSSETSSFEELGIEAEDQAAFLAAVAEGMLEMEGVDQSNADDFMKFIAQDFFSFVAEEFEDIPLDEFTSECMVELASVSSEGDGADFFGGILDDIATNMMTALAAEFSADGLEMDPDFFSSLMGELGEVGLDAELLEAMSREIVESAAAFEFEDGASLSEVYDELFDAMGDIEGFDESFLADIEADSAAYEAGAAACDAQGLVAIFSDDGAGNITYTCEDPEAYAEEIGDSLEDSFDDASEDYAEEHNEGDTEEGTEEEEEEEQTTI